jgi:hypothetical protein
VENAGSPAARLMTAPLARLGETIEAAAPSGPVLLIIGEVASRARSAKVEAGFAVRTRPYLEAGARQGVL